MDTATISATGEVTIPQAIRERFGLRAGTLVQFEETSKGELRVRRLTSAVSERELTKNNDTQFELTKAAKIQRLRELHAHAKAAGDKRSARWYARETGLNDKTVKAYLDNPDATDLAKLGQGRRA